MKVGIVVDENEKRIADWLDRKNLRVEEFAKKEKKKSKTPDFRVFKDDEFAFFCEVKTIDCDTWLDEQLSVVPSGTMVERFRRDPTYNRLTDDIHTAVGQFEAVNPNRKNLNVLAFVNHDKKCGFLDLLGVITGDFFSEGGGRHPIFVKYSNGRIKEEKRKIDFYLWIDDFKPERFLFSDLSDKKTEKLCSYFGMNIKEIKEI